MNRVLLYLVVTGGSFAALQLFASDASLFYLPIVGLAASLRLAAWWRQLALANEPVPQEPPQLETWEAWEAEMRDQLATNTDYFAEERAA